MDAAGYCLLVPGDEVASCWNLGGPGANAVSLVGGVRVLKTLALLPTHWQMKPGPGVSPGYWQAELVPGVWLLDPGIPELVSDR